MPNSNDPRWAQFIPETDAAFVAILEGIKQQFEIAREMRNEIEQLKQWVDAPCNHCECPEMHGGIYDSE